MEEYETIWVCVDCIMHHANGECGSCGDAYGPHDEKPLSALVGLQVAMGMAYSEHAEDCRIERQLTGDTPDWCECETNTFSTSQCEGCGSHLHGERHAITLFKG